MVFSYPSFAQPDTENHLSFLYITADMLKNLKQLLERYSARFITDVNEEERRFWETLTDVADSAFHVGCNLHDFAMQAYEAERALTTDLRNNPQRAPEWVVVVNGLPDCLYTCISLWEYVEQLFPLALPFLRRRLSLPEDTLFMNCHHLSRNTLQALGRDIDRVDTAFQTFCSWRLSEVLI
jgi:hypothetical protein